MGISEREDKRKQSVVKAMIEEAPESERKPETESRVNIEIVVKPRPEARSKRVNFVVTPTLYKKVTKKCKDMGISLNECINQFLEKWAES